MGCNLKKQISIITQSGCLCMALRRTNLLSSICRVRHRFVTYAYVDAVSRKVILIDKLFNE